MKLKKKKFTKNHIESPVKKEYSPNIKPIEPFNKEVFDYANKISGGENKNTFNIADFIEKNHQKFKILTMNNQLKVLFYYIKENSKNGLYKRPSLRILAEYFGGVDKNTISKRLKVLQEKEYIRPATEIDLQETKNIYKVLKNEFKEER